MSALGLIETKGLVSAIEAADAMVKSADVHIIDKQQVGGGLVTITVTGEVSAVKAAVDAAIVAVGRIQGGHLISSHVIPRPYDEVATLFVKERTDPQPVKPVEPVTSVTGKSTPTTEPTSAKAEQDTKTDATEDVAVVKDPAQIQQQKSYTFSELQKLQVVKLRQLAEELEGISMSKQAIKSATKKKLIEAIVKVTK